MPPTHYIEQFRLINSPDDRFYFSEVEPINELEKDLEYTKLHPNLKTVAVFLITPKEKNQ